MADEKKRSSALTDLINKIKASEASKPRLTEEEAIKIATKEAVLDLGGGASVKLERKLVGSETVTGTLKEVAKVAADGIKEYLKKHPEMTKEGIRAQMVVMDGNNEQGTIYQVDADGKYYKSTGDDFDTSGFPTHSAIEMMKLLDKRMKINFGKDKHKDMPMPDDPNQAAIISVVNKLHKQRHEQVEMLIELLAAVATYEAVAEQSPAEIKQAGDLHSFIECCNKTIIDIIKGNASLCTLFHALEHIPIPGHSKLEIGKVN